MGLNFPFTPSILTPSIPTILVYYRCCYSVWVNGNIHRSIEYKQVWGRKWSFLAFVIVFLTFVIWMKKTEQCLNSQKNIKPQIQQSALEIITRIFNANYAESDNDNVSPKPLEVDTRYYIPRRFMISMVNVHFIIFFTHNISFHRFGYRFRSNWNDNFRFVDRMRKEF